MKHETADKLLDDFTQCSLRQRTALMRFFTDKLPERHKLVIMKWQQKAFMASREKFKKLTREQLSYGALCLAIRAYKSDLEKIDRKEKLTPKDMKRIDDFFMDRIYESRKKKKSKTKNFIAKYAYEEIKRLKKNGVSWRELADHVAFHHKKKISHSHLRKLFLELEAEEKADSRLAASAKMADSEPDAIETKN